MHENDWNGVRYWLHTPTEDDANLCRRWKARTFEELRSVLKLDLFPGKKKSGYHHYLHDTERKQSERAFIKGSTNYDPYNTFEYFLNELGFRGHTCPPVESKQNIAFFGCSFTFGIGLPEEDHFVKMINDNFGITTFNFGIPGGGIPKIARVFEALCRFQKLNIAIFNLPHVGRIEYPFVYGNEKGDFTISNMILNHNHVSPYEDVVRVKLADTLSDLYLKQEYVRNLAYIEHVASIYNVKVGFTSWDIPAHDLISTYFIDDPEKVLPWFQYVEYDGKNRARDGAHPGKQSSVVFVKKVTPYINMMMEE